MARKSVLAVWRDAVRDSSLSTTCKSVAWCLSTYMDARGVAWPSRGLLARGSSLGAGLRSVDRALRELEAAGFVTIERSRGRSSHRYLAGIPATAHEMRRSEWATARQATPNRANGASNRAANAPESIESVESRAGAPINGAAVGVCDECETGGGLHVEGCSRAAVRT